MKIEDIPDFDNFEYSKVCDNCFRVQKVYTQGEEGEYQTGVYVECQCGNILEFILPVN